MMKVILKYEWIKFMWKTVCCFEKEVSNDFIALEEGFFWSYVSYPLSLIKYIFSWCAVAKFRKESTVSS